jgi:hypothetical protein
LIYRKSAALQPNDTLYEGDVPPFLQAPKPVVGPGLPRDAAARKGVPIVTGVLDYFPDAIAAVAECSRVGNEQHNPGSPLHWDRSKSGDEADALGRHLLERGSFDVDGVRHSAKLAWRALALLQKEIEAETPKGLTPEQFGAVGDNAAVIEMMSQGFQFND